MSFRLPFPPIAAVNSALQALGEAAEVERAYLFLFRQDLATLGPAFEWYVCTEVGGLWW